MVPADDERAIGQFHPQTRLPAAQNHRTNSAHVTGKQ